MKLSIRNIKCIQEINLRFMYLGDMRIKFLERIRTTTKLSRLFRGNNEVKSSTMNQ